jgi:hypothetical protein
MGKQAKPIAVRAGEVVKAGKKKPHVEPPAENQSNKDRRDKGYQQFISPVQLTVKDTKFVFDKKTQQFTWKLVDVNVPYMWDESRKHFVYSPGQVD